MISKKEFDKSYSVSMQDFYEKKTVLNNIKEPDIIDILFEPLKPKMFKENGKFNVMWIIWHFGLILGKIKAALDIRKQQKSDQSKRSIGTPTVLVADPTGFLTEDNRNYLAYIKHKGLGRDYHDWLKEAQRFPPNAQD